MSGVLAPAGARGVLAALGVLAAALVVGTAATVGFGLATGFDRAADRADLPHVIARFDARGPRARRRAGARAARTSRPRSYRLRGEERRPARERAQHAARASLHIVLGRPARLRGRRGPRPARPGRGAWSSAGSRGSGTSHPGDRMALVPRLGRAHRRRRRRARQRRLPAHGHAARLHVARRRGTDPRVRSTSRCSGSPTPRAPTSRSPRRARRRSGSAASRSSRARAIEVLLGQAAGIVIALLVAFSLVALVAAGTMLAAAAQADVQRRLPALRRAARARLHARPAGGGAGGRGGAGRRAGRARRPRARARSPCAGRRARCWRSSTSCRPARALLPVLAACLLGILAIVTAAATWPAWRAARRPPAEILRGGDLARPRRRGPRAAAAAASSATAAASAGPGLLATGARFAVAARGRFAATVATIAVCAGVVTLMLALASLLQRLRDDPGRSASAIELTVRLNPFDVDAVERDPRRRGGVRALPGRRRRLLPARRAAADGRLPRRPHALRGAAARGGPAAADRRRGGGRASGWPTRSACGRARRSPCRRRAAARRASASAASCGRSSTTAGSPTCGPPACSPRSRTWARRSPSGSRRAPTARPSGAG